MYRCCAARYSRAGADAADWWSHRGRRSGEERGGRFRDRGAERSGSTSRAGLHALRGDQSPAASGLFDCGDQPPEDDALKLSGTHPEIKADHNQRYQDQHTTYAQRNMAEEEAPQAARLGRLPRIRKLGFGLAHWLPFPSAPRALLWTPGFASVPAGVAADSSAGSRTSTSPCLRRLVSHSSNRTFTCCCSSISSMRGETFSRDGTASPGAYSGKSVCL